MIKRFFKWIAGRVRAMQPTKQELLEDFISRISKEILMGSISGNRLSNKEIGLITQDLVTTIKENLQDRQEQLEQDLKETVEVLRKL